MSRVLITGGAGFVGSHTADALVAAGHEVRVLDILDPQVHGEGLASNGQFPAYMHRDVECIQGDVRNPKEVAGALRDIDVVFHFAALTGVGQSMYDLASYVDTNVTGTATLLEAIIQRNGPRLERLVLASSRAVYGEGAQSCPTHQLVYPNVRCRHDLEAGIYTTRCPHCSAETRAVPTAEQRPLKPLSIYGLTKLQQEELCRQTASSFELPVSILRYFNVYGSRQSLQNAYTGVVSIFYSRLQAGEPVFLYEQGTPGRDFVHIRDVVQANLLAMQTPTRDASCFNVGTGVSASIAEVASALAHAVGCEPDLQPVGEFRIGDIHACYADLSCSRTQLGYRPRVSLHEGMREFAVWAAGEQSCDLYAESVAALERHQLMGHTTGPSHVSSDTRSSVAPAAAA